MWAVIGKIVVEVNEMKSDEVYSVTVNQLAKTLNYRGGN